MITTFDTTFDTAILPASVVTPSGSGKGSNALLWVVGIAAVIFIGYKFVYLPMKARKEAEARSYSQNDEIED